MKSIPLILGSTLLGATLLFTGCGDDSTDDACVYAVQQNLDQGNYALVIASLENNQTCGGQLSQEDAWLNLAAAYMGEAGLTMGNLLGAVTDSNSSSAMSSFMTSFAAAATAEGLANLDNANAVYAYLDTTVCDGNETGAQAEACLYSGLVSLTSAVGSLSAILGSETLELLGTTVVSGGPNDLNSNGKLDQLEITACALEDAVSNLGGCSGTPTIINYVANAPLFTDDTNNYVVQKYSIATNNGYKLIHTDVTPNQLVTTEGFCLADGKTACSDIDSNTSCMPCIVRSADGNATTVVTSLIDTINNGGLESLGNFLPEENNTTDANITADLTTSIYDACFTEGGGAACSDDGQISEDELSFFLNNL